MLVVSVHLVVDGNAPPAGWRGTVAVSPIEGAGHPVELDGLIGKLIIRGAFDLDGEVVPLVVDGIAGNTSRNPFSAGVIPDIPFVARRDAALVAEDETHAIEKLIDVEL